MSLTRVDLPDPLGPAIPTISPLRISKSTVFKAVKTRFLSRPDISNRRCQRGREGNCHPTITFDLCSRRERFDIGFFFGRQRVAPKRRQAKTACRGQVSIHLPSSREA